MKSKLLILSLLLLVGCTTPQPQACFQLECPECVCNQAKTIASNLVYVDFIDVGQGQAVLIRYDNKASLIDCGKHTSGQTVVDFANSKGIKDLDYLVITHPDSDHIGGCDTVLSDMKVSTVIWNGETSDTTQFNEAMQLIDTEQKLTAIPGATYQLGNAILTILQANNNLPDTNEDSIVSMLTYKDVKFLFTGDCDNECERLLLNKDINATILQVAHHGSKYATGIEFLTKVTPNLAVIQVGSNSYGHPSDETLDRLNQEGITIGRTDQRGTVEISTDGVGYT